MKDDVKVSFTTVGTDKDQRKHFIAAAFALGFEMADGTTGCSNVYSSSQKFEPGQPGEIRYMLALDVDRISINAFVEVWLDPYQALNDAEGLPARILSASDSQQLIKCAEKFNLNYMRAAIAHIQLYSKGQIRIPNCDYAVNLEEEKAIDYLDSVSSLIAKAHDSRSKAKIVQGIKKHWKPAMIAWIKAYRGNLLELGNLWKEAPESISIDTGGRFPLVIPRGPKFKQMLQRWT